MPEYLRVGLVDGLVPSINSAMEDHTGNAPSVKTLHYFI
jgi:hypothetical protein